MTVQGPELVAETPYLWRARRDGPRRHRLICFPHAGGVAGAYAGWVALLPEEIELAAVQLPGRQNRIMEPAATAVGPLVATLTQALRPAMDGPFSFFGHSAGATMAFEVARALQAQGRPGPEHLFLSAEPAPSAGWQRPVWHDLPEDEFRERVISLGGIHPEVVGHKDAMSVLLTTVRADFRLWEPHRPAPGPRLDAPITVVAGASDARTPLDTLDGWAQETTGPFETRVYPGDHFYFLEDPEALVRYLGEVMLSSQPLGRPA